MTLQISNISTNKNLLGFSGGVDSSALFFLLLENNIPFDIVIVDYNLREQSKKEVAYAKELAKKYNKNIYLKEVKLENSSNFEKQARDIRYKFFEEIIEKYFYETLITAHQLNDKLEWFLMQFSKGAGLPELISFEEFTQKNNYTICRPLINISKNDLLKYLDENKIQYFVDESNYEEKYKRNYFRKNYANQFIEEFESGIKKSFEYLKKDVISLNTNLEPFFTKNDLELYKLQNDDNINIRLIDISLKKRGFLLSKAQRDEIIKQKECVVSHKISINLTSDYIFIAPYIQENMPKKFKEKCRIEKLPKNIRPYIFKENILEEISKVLN
ncbi:MAG: tRNA lysidine(34) synthetase TilS [Arcobacter sp.]|nr:MAG: tRNA lysidine(34) synthetase TilS [Arcobacter sp.]